MVSISMSALAKLGKENKTGAQGQITVNLALFSPEFSEHVIRSTICIISEAIIYYVRGFGLGCRESAANTVD